MKIIYEQSIKQKFKNYKNIPNNFQSKLTNDELIFLNNFLQEHPEYKTIKFIIYFYIHSQTNCVCCNKKIPINILIKNKYAKYCSKQCAKKLRNIHYKENFKIKYGVQNPSQLSFIKNKIKHTNFKKIWCIESSSIIEN